MMCVSGGQKWLVYDGVGDVVLLQHLECLLPEPAVVAELDGPLVVLREYFEELFEVAGALLVCEHGARLNEYRPKLLREWLYEVYEAPHVVLDALAELEPLIVGDELRELRGEYEARWRGTRPALDETLSRVAIEGAVDLRRAEDLCVVGEHALLLVVERAYPLVVAPP